MEEVLVQCEKAANRGYKIAVSQYKNLSTTLNLAGVEVETAIGQFNNSSCYVGDAANALEKQLIDIKNTFNAMPLELKRDIDNLKRNLSNFSITLFGRTKAGKSTLMEIFTQGNGDSIGNGAQRTTRDVRKYTWNQLQITDVPGIGAFEGEEDEQIAFEAAKSADLILFLITDDAPQAIEAECFGRIVKLGKPVICIMNVKKAVAEETNIKLAIRDITKQFNNERLNAIKNQFLSNATRLGQEWGHVHFVYVHLLSAFMAQKTSDKELAKSLYDVSRIGYLKHKIIEQVKSKGEFYRIKNFVDIVSNPITESMENLLSQSLHNSAQGRTILAKKKSLAEWKDKFQRDGNNRIDSAIIKIKGLLNSEVAAFAEEHFEDTGADKAWEKLLKQKKVEKECQTVLDKLKDLCNDKLEEITREIEKELQFVTRQCDSKALNMQKIHDFKKAWSWSSLVVGGGLSVAAGIAFLVGAASSGPLGWIALGVNIVGILGSFLFKSRSKKEAEARTRLENNLRQSISQLCENMQEQMEENFNKMIKNRVEAVMRELDRINSVLFSLADTQKELAWKLDQHLLELNFKIITEALKLIGADGLQYHIISVARIPGIANVFMLNDGTVFPERQKEQLQSLLSEYIGFVYNTENKRILVSRVIGKSIDRSQVSLEEKIGVIHIPLEDATPNIINRIRMAQQLSMLAITK